jgi:hypothetical protein
VEDLEEVFCLVEVLLEVDLVVFFLVEVLGVVLVHRHLVH